MHYALSLPTKHPWSVVSIHADASHGANDGHTHRDPRWGSLVAQLEVLRRRRRRAVRIVDVNCGNGALLIEAVKQAQALGFLAIEGLGVERDPALVDAARLGSHLLDDPAIGLDFERAEPLAQLEAEAEFPADIILYEAPANVSEDFRNAVRRAGDLALRGYPSPQARP